MKILALEFSSRLRSAAVANIAKDGEVNVPRSAQDADFRGVTGLMLIERALKEAQVKPADISVIAIGLGPGSYTGIRSAIAIGQGWQLGRAVKVVGVSSTLCLAEEARTRGIIGELTVIVDAQRGEVYVEKWELDSDCGRKVGPLHIVRLNEIPANGVVIGPEASKLLPGAVDVYPSAATLAGLVNVGNARPGEQLEPVYLRESSFVKAPPPRHIE